MTLDLTSLRRAVSSLKTALAVIEAQKDASEDLYKTLRSGVIKNFEFTYELSWKFIQRWIRENQSPAEVEDLRTRKDLFRRAAKYGLIQNPLRWFEYADARNETSHTYKEETAIQVLKQAQKFLPDVGYLLEQLEQRNA